VSVVRPVILSGGSGNRLWPLSNPEQPKQFLRLFGDESLFESTIRRASHISAHPPTIVTGASHVEMVMAEAPSGAMVLVEPAPRNTAAAVVAAALVGDPEDISVILPADHLVSNVDAFAAAVATAVDIAELGGIVTLGVIPTRPETGYGWIKVGPTTTSGGSEIVEFVEKPTRDRAATMLEGGEYLWNSGVFIARNEQIQQAARLHAPLVVAAVEASIPRDRAIRIVLGSEFLESPSTSFDKAVMEQIPDGKVVPLDAGWSDVGSWISVWENTERDSAGNAVRGHAITVDSENSMVWSSGRPIALVGLQGVVVVETDEGILVADIASGQEIRSVVARMNSVPPGEGK
jgi:mannose-1-phosphate guanylyltransferase/mannose-6-phosphate isomerase